MIDPSGLEKESLETMIAEGGFFLRGGDTGTYLDHSDTERSSAFFFSSGSFFSTVGFVGSFLSTAFTGFLFAAVASRAPRTPPPSLGTRRRLLVRGGILIYGSISQSVYQSINQSIYQSINLWIKSK